MCGWCCENLVPPIDFYFPLEKLGEDYAEARGMSVKDGVGHKRLPVFDPCQHLWSDMKCAIHNSKPNYCRKWPFEPDHVVGVPCTYWFENEDGDVIGGLRSPHPTEKQGEG